MKRNRAIRNIAIASTLLSASALGQSHFCIGGDLDHLTQPQRMACVSKVQAVQQAAAAFHAPVDWHFIVVCGEEGWKSYAAFSLEGNPSILEASADTHLAERETFLREDRLDLGNLQHLRRVVAHEVAGILLHSKDETAINRQLAVWTGESQQAGI